MKLAQLLIATASLALAGPALAHDTSDKFDVMDAVTICKDMIADFDAGKAKLMEQGWAAPDREISEVYSGPDSTSLVRGDAVLFFIGKQAFAAMGRDENGKGSKGVCQIVLPGDSVVAATKLAHELGVTASSFKANARDISNSVDFSTDTLLLEVASVNRENTMTRLQYVPR